MSKAQSTTADQSVDPRAYRNVIGSFATGVTVIAAGEGEGFHGMTANAVTSLSLEPLLVLVCVGKKARMADHLKQETGFSINVLRREQEDLSTYFAGAWPAETPPAFKFTPWHGGPLLEDCVAALGCELHEIIEGGDHWIFIGHVIAVHQSPNPVDPLIFFRGRYRELVKRSEIDGEDIHDTALWAFPW